MSEASLRACRQRSENTPRRSIRRYPGKHTRQLYDHWYGVELAVWSGDAWPLNPMRKLELFGHICPSIWASVALCGHIKDRTSSDCSCIAGTTGEREFTEERREGCNVLAQLRTGMVRLNTYLHQIKAAASDQCACGHARETIEHFLFRCTQWTAHRAGLLRCTETYRANLSFYLGGKSPAEGSAGREEEAVALLTKLAHGDAPFDHKPQPASKGAIFRRDFKELWPKVTLWPVLALLESLTGLSLDLIDRNRVNFWRTRLCEKICVVEIENKTVRVFPMECEAYHTLGMLGPDGIRFNDGRALLGLVCPGRIPFQCSPVQWNAPVNRSKSTLWTRSPRHAFRKSKFARLQMNRYYP